LKTFFLGLACLCFISSCYTKDLDASSLRYPYNTIDKVLPYDPHGWCCPYNRHRLAQLINEFKADTIIEIGSWLGTSTRFLAERLGPKGMVYAVDHWKGSSEHLNGLMIEKLPTLYEQFLSNTIHAGLTDKIVPVRMSSLEAAKALIHIKPNIVYIDAGHETKDVLADLNAWYPYIEHDGIICGDDWTWASVRKAVELFAEEHNLNIIAQKNFWELRK